MADVRDIEAQTVVEVEIASATDLPQAREAGLHLYGFCRGEQAVRYVP